MGVVVQLHAPDDLPPGTIRYPLYTRLAGARAGLDGCGKSWPPPEFDSGTVDIPTELSNFLCNYCFYWGGGLMAFSLFEIIER
jgi:hypothetical protein